jgi:cell division protein FtsW
MIALVMLEPDLGTTLCFLLLLLGLLWMVGLPYRYFAGLLLTVAGAVTLMAVLEPYRLVRLTTFLHPFADKQGNGFHTVQGLYALSSGGLFGVGLGQGTSKYGWVPNANTDYVFAVVGEELGLLGCVVVLALFALFTYAGIRIAMRCNDPFVRLVASGAAVWIAGQALINIGYVTALLPVTGIPLPFISNGGTSLVLTCGVLGMLVSFARHEPAAVKAAQRSAHRGDQALWVRMLRLGVPKQREARAARPKQPPSAVPRRNEETGVPRRPQPGPAPRRTQAAAQPRRSQPAAQPRRTQTSAPARLRPTGTDGRPR